MIRKLSLAMAIAAALSPIDAFALGVGEIHIKSALNQLLEADIELHSLAEGELDDVKVKLASPDAFSKAGLDRPYILTDLKFKPTRKKDGKAAIKVTSSNPIREPFLNFLIEINWSQGKLLREFTLLLDPPTTLKRKPPVVEPARVKEPLAPVKREPPPQPVAEEPAPKPKPKAPAGEVKGGDYTVRRNDSVWKIAERHRPKGVSMEEMMIALYRANPEAFYGGRIGNLKYGAIMRMPSREELGNLSYAQARNEYLAQVSAWQSTTYTETLVTKNPAQTPVPAQPKSQPAGESAVTPAPAVAPGKAVPEQDARVEILAAKPEGKGPAGDEAGKDQVENLKRDLLLAREATESVKQESGELKSRVKDLEGQVTGLERLIKLKNDQLAQMQAMAEAKEKAKQQQAAEKISEAAVAEKAQEQTRTPVAEGPKTEQEKMAEAMAKLSGGVPEKTRKPAEATEQSAETLAKGEAVKEPAEKAVETTGEVVRSAAEKAGEAIDTTGEAAKEAAEKVAGTTGEVVRSAAEKTGEAGEAAKEMAGKAVEATSEKAVEAAKKVVKEAGKAAGTSQGSGAKIIPAEQPGTIEAVPLVPEKAPAELAQPVERPPVEGAEGQQAATPPVQEQPPAEQTLPEQAPPQQAQEPVAEESILAQLLGSPLVLGGGVVALILALLLLMKGRGVQRKPIRGEEAIPDIPVSELTDDDSIPVSFEDSETLGRGRIHREEDEDTSSSFLTDFTPSELEQLGDETADVDPSSESDVYMAYGRYQQAQELMKEAVEREPDRDDLKLKYLEVLHASNAKAPFTEVAAKYAAEGLRERDPNGWNKIAKLGREFSPSNGLFTEIAAAMPAAGSAARAASPAPKAEKAKEKDDFEDFDLSAEGLDDTELSLSELEKQFASQTPVKAAKPSGSPLADLALDTSQQAGGQEFSELDFEGLDFGEGLEEEPLGDISAELTGLAPAAKGEKPKAPEPEESTFDFDLDALDFTDFGKGDGKGSGGSIFDTVPPVAKVKEEDFNFDLGDLNLDMEASEMSPDEIQGIPEPETQVFDLSSEGLDLDHLEDLSELRTETLDQESFGLFGLGDLPPTEQIDEIQTKLELAQAYQEMGDSEGARSILDEVLAEGNDTQKAAAKKMMSSL